MSRNDHAVHRQAPPGPDDDDVARGDLRCTHFACRVPPAHECLVWQEVEQVLDRASPAPDGQPFEHLCDQDEEEDDEGGEELADRQGRTDGDRHRELHRHPSRPQGRECRLEDGIAADQRRGEADHAHTRERFPQAQPHSDAGDRHQADAHELPRFEPVISWLSFWFVVIGNWGGLNRCSCSARHVMRLRNDAHYLR